MALDTLTPNRAAAPRRDDLRLDPRKDSPPSTGLHLQPASESHALNRFLSSNRALDRLIHEMAPSPAWPSFGGYQSDAINPYSFAKIVRGPTILPGWSSQMARWRGRFPMSAMGPRHEQPLAAEPRRLFSRRGLIGCRGSSLGRTRAATSTSTCSARRRNHAEPMLPVPPTGSDVCSIADNALDTLTPNRAAGDGRRRPPSIWQLHLQPAS